ncbi:polyhydroxyalkanoic acid system family protein [Pseudomonas sp. GD03842]|uniref:polyhydroxyalkanoic acid system family protein n=1 Tax=unclassified Pseudomonas TaxID=196821 RepID=UPI000D33311E|nr:MULTISPECIES: polyhydroxyalkanoic acid system family protein [unclassified Pseudomonas]MDH0746481.1 polyhydroxyalkanoic acid system family protein [Pseudomonas sp. GD03842]RAU46503.1 polyhydroxyalkanoic acid system protein [Pseudomonas sp. RIT 409]RAU52484.1 polyhydroxyalkanoic acid system protein [Pseudomonas sp. RIT 412]
MARITVERPHALGKEKAREKAELLAQKLGDKYGIEHSWEDDTVSLEGKGAKGTVQVEEALVRVEIELNFFLSAMSSTIQSEVERQLDKALHA